MRSSIVSAFVIAALSLAACADDQAAADDEADEDAGPAAADLDLTDLQIKATHNSYHVEKAGNTLADWKYTHVSLTEQLSEQGVRGVELDTHFNATSGEIEVHHLPGLDDGTTCGLLRQCLMELKAWSDDNPGHHVLFVQIEPKDAEINQTPDYEAYADALDAVLRETWTDKRIVTPADVIATNRTLGEAIHVDGFPSIESTRNKLLVYLDEHADFSATYAKTLRSRLAFPTSHPGEGTADTRAIVIANDPNDPATRAAVDQGLLVRTRADSVPLPSDLEGQRAAALASGAQIVTTDFPVDRDGVAGLVVPKGGPSRCNPVTAPEDCTARAIEDLQ